ncbi:cobalt transporter [Dactylosporangium sp. CS-047395]|uniref:HoxN/HupN/NixA family nickel/cobalt transporter n=1 Tax=Dactylosporangium sp. CS-047395 TaxID=3239936 RepID=UPI003D8F6416
MNGFTDWAASVSTRLEELVHAPGIAPLAFVLAFVAGAGHAVTPGHGKTLAAAYLAGSRGRVRDAAFLGGTVAVMHTVSVLVIGVAWTFLSLSGIIGLEQLTTWLQIAAGVLVVLTGLWLLHRHVRKAHQHHHHDHDHDHEASGKRPGLVLLGVSGGLTPSPSAFLVLATGLFLGRAGFALLLVLTFGLGMAVVLFAAGLLAIAGTSVVARGTRSMGILRRASHLTPVLAAGGITLFGAGLVTAAALHLAAA